MPQPKSVAIIGGGITGLAAALRLTESNPNLPWTLFEASPRLGGALQTIEQDGWRIERSADNFLTRDPWALDLSERVGIKDDLLPTDPSRRRAFVVRNGKVCSIPEGFVLMTARKTWPILASPLLSPLGKLRLACEPLIPRKRANREDGQDADESVASFVRRRLGREAFERLVQPLVSGIYTADPEKLSIRATLPQFQKQEAEFGSLWRAAYMAPRTGGPKPKLPKSKQSESGASYGLFAGPRLGMQQIPDAIVAKLPAEQLRTSTPVAHCEPLKDRSGWQIQGPKGEPLGEFDAVIITLPTHHAADVVHGFDASLADELSGIEYAGSSVVCLGVRDEQIARPIQGFGFVVPSIEGRQIISASFASYKFPGRAPKGHTLIRVFIGGALQPELANRDDDELIRIARKELSELVGLSGEPVLTSIARWTRQMPQYHMGHLDRVARIEKSAESWPGLTFAGAAYRGVGVPQCIRSGELAAERVMNA